MKPQGFDVESLLQRWGASPGLLALLLVLGSVAATLGSRRWMDQRSRRRRVARAQRAERDAAGLLEASGYEVLGRQVRQSWSLLADSEEIELTLIADYLVQRSGRRWVAEVKTGSRALDLRHGPTRRQLLEYRQAFAVDGILLVDAEAQRVRSILFRDRLIPPRGGRWLPFGAGVLAGIALAAYWSSAVSHQAGGPKPNTESHDATQRAVAAPEPRRAAARAAARTGQPPSAVVR